MNIKQFLLFFLILILGESALGQPQYEQFRFGRYTVKEGLPQSYPYHIIQDQKGFIWFGTEHGLCRYDGFTFRTLRHSQHERPSLSSNVVYRVSEDSEGMLWALTSDNLVNRIDPATGKSQHLRFYNSASKKNVLIIDIKSDTAGTTWLATTDGLHSFDPQTRKTRRLHFRPHPQLSARDTIGRLLIRKNGNFMVAGIKGLFEIDRSTGFTKPLLVLPTGSKVPTYINEFLEDSAGWVWTTTNNSGLYAISLDDQRVTHYVHDPADRESLGSNFCRSLQLDSKGRIWVSTANGVSIFSPDTQRWKRILPVPGDDFSLMDRSVGSLLKDKEGLMWVGTSLGLHKYDPQLNRFQNFSHNPVAPTSLAASNVDPVVEDSAGNLWIGTRGAGVDYFNRKAGTFSHFKHDPNNSKSLSNDNIIGLYLAPDQTLWIGTTKGLNKLDNKKGLFKRYFHDPADPTSLSANYVSQIRHDLQGRLWVGTYGYGLNVQKGDGTFERFEHQPDDSTTLSGNTIYGLEVDKEGRLWIATDQGMCRYLPKTNSFKRYGLMGRGPKKHSQWITFFVLVTQDGTVWAGGHQGLERWNPSTDTFKAYTHREGLTHDGVVGIAEDRRGNLWISTFAGIAHFNPATEEFKFFDQSKGLQSNEFNFGAIRLRNTGELVFTGMFGFNIFHPDSIRDNPYRPPVVISTLRKYVVNSDPLTVLVEQNISHEQSLTFDYSNNLLAFEFTAMSFSNPALNQYAYQLAGQSDQWYQLGTKREVTFAGLAPGEYILRVKASNSDGVWNEVPTELSITVLPPWWRTWWAYGLYLLLFGLALRAYIVFRSRALRRENRLLEEKVALRTDQLQRKSSELETSLTELKTTQTQLIQKEKLASLGELTAGIAHEIQNPLNFVNNYSEVNVELIEALQEEVEKGDTEEIKAILADLGDNERKIHHHGRRADAIVRGMLEHARATPGEKVPTDLNALADEYLRLAYHGLRAKDSAFECELVTDFDPNLGRVEVAPSELGRVLLNLFNNAFYAVRQRSMLVADQAYTSTVWVSTTKLPLLTGEGGGGRRYGEVERQEVIIKVRDNGTGMPEEVKAKIFQPFFTTKPTGEGTGLGLSLSYDIVTKGHGGALRVESCVGEGTEFVIELPV